MPKQPPGRRRRGDGPPQRRSSNAEAAPGRRLRGDGPPRRRSSNAVRADAPLQTMLMQPPLSRKRLGAATRSRGSSARRRISGKGRSPTLAKVTSQHIRCSGGCQPFWAFQMAINAVIRRHEDPPGNPTCDGVEIFSTALFLSAVADGRDRVHSGFSPEDDFIVFTWPRMLNWLSEEQLHEVVKDGVTNIWISHIPGTKDTQRQQRDNVPPHLPCPEWTFVIERVIGTDVSKITFRPTWGYLPSAIVQPCPAMGDLTSRCLPNGPTPVSSPAKLVETYEVEWGGRDI